MKIVEMLNSIVKDELISFHVPGHKLGKIYDKLGYTEIMKNLYKIDTTEIEGTDNLHLPEGIIKKSQENTAKVFNSDYTYYLINGTTCGIEAAIMSVCSPKDKIIVNRDCHQSVINACILGDIEPIYIQPKIDEDTYILKGIDFINTKKVIDNNLDAKAILLTYPTYYGNTYNLKEICEYAKQKDMIIIVDEAHGSHLGLGEELPSSAITQGADIVIQSTHKTLPALTQASMLHIKGNKIDKNKLSSVLRMLQTSSPSYVLLSSIEIGVDIYEKYGRELMDKLIKNINTFVEEVSEIKNIDIYCGEDKTKIFISAKELGITGYKLDEILRKNYNIQVELSNYYGSLLICTIANENSDFLELQKALLDISNKNSKNTLEKIDFKMNIPQKKINPRQAYYSKTKTVLIEDSIGKVSGEYIIPYPPGISLISPGEIITKEVIDYIILCKEKGMNINGIKDTNLKFIDIIE